VHIYIKTVFTGDLSSWIDIVFPRLRSTRFAISNSKGNSHFIGDTIHPICVKRAKLSAVYTTLY